MVGFQKAALAEETHTDVQGRERERSMCELTPLGQALKTLMSPEKKGLTPPLPPSAKRMAVFTPGSRCDHGRLVISSPTCSEFEPLPELLRLLLALCWPIGSVSLWAPGHLGEWLPYGKMWIRVSLLLQTHNWVYLETRKL